MSPECETLETPKAASTPKTTFLRKAWQSYSCQDHGGDLENDLVKQYLPHLVNIFFKNKLLKNDDNNNKKKKKHLSKF